MSSYGSQETGSFCPMITSYGLSWEPMAVLMMVRSYLSHWHTIFLHLIFVNMLSSSTRLYLGWFVLQVSIATRRSILSNVRLRLDMSITKANLATLPPCYNTNLPTIVASPTKLPGLVSLPCPHSISKSPQITPNVYSPRALVIRLLVIG